MDREAASQQVDENTSFLDFFLNTEEASPGLVLAIGYAGYRTVKDLIRDRHWRARLKQHGATEPTIEELERRLREQGLSLFFFSMEEVRSIIGQDDQAERIARTVASTPGNADANLQYFLEAATGENIHYLPGSKQSQKEAELTRRVELSSAWKELVLDAMSNETPLENLGLDQAAQDAFAKLKIHNLGDLRSHRITVCGLYDAGCQEETVSSIWKILAKFGIKVINDNFPSII